MYDKIKTEKLLHHFAASTGGFLGGYAIVNHCDVFGNAQTTNMIKIIRDIVLGDFAGLPILGLCFLVYVAGNIFSVIAEKLIPADLKLVSLLLTCAAVAVIGASPAISNDYLALLPIFFVTPVQWNAFINAGEYSSSTIFSTNNLRVAVTSLTAYLLTGERAERDKAKFFWATLMFFHIGVAFSCAASMLAGTAGIWLALLPLTATALTYFYIKSKAQESKIHSRFTQSN